jgi:predicted RNA binding protein YcfA (HicA-like mRNA interferase family)
MKVRDAIRLLEGEGWFLVATRGSHRQYKHGSAGARDGGRQTFGRSCARHSEQYLEAIWL